MTTRVSGPSRIWDAKAARRVRVGGRGYSKGYAYGRSMGTHSGSLKG